MLVKAIVDGSKIAVTYTGVLLVLSFLVSFTLPNGHKLSSEEIKSAEVME